MKYLLSFVLAFFFLSGFGQVNANDTISVVDTTKHHSIKTAVILSAVVPGSGQVYNHIAMPKGQKKAFWKVPLIYAGLGTTGYFLVQNQQKQKAFKQEYINRTEFNIYSNEFPYDDEGILTLYKQHLDRRDLFILGFGLVYLLQVVDAGIEAHFVNFDVSENLSMTVQPALLPSNNVGLQLRINFR